jgi:hypothetical protein
MCCFSKKVEHVVGTKIFARDSDKSLQFLVYEMKFEASEDLAMILPLPVPRNTPEDGVRFVDLEKYADFFKDMESGFPSTVGRGMAGMGGFGGGAAKPLTVVSVGSFEASFVPSIAHFARLDERFRLPDGTWEKIPRYKNFGFAVFKLKQGPQKVHPMAFEFPRVSSKQLFFPTVHIHDGELHDRADFDHLLYAQFGDRHPPGLHVWTESAQPAGMFLKTEKCEDMVDEESHAYRRLIRGAHKNADVIV